MVKCSNCRRVYEVKGARGRSDFPCPNCGTSMSAWKQIPARNFLRTTRLTPHEFMGTLGEDDSTSPSDDDERSELLEDTREMKKPETVDEQLRGCVDVTVEHHLDPGQLFDEAEQIWRAEQESEVPSRPAVGWNVETPRATQTLPPDLSELSGEDEYGVEPEIELTDGDWEEVDEAQLAYSFSRRPSVSYAVVLVAAVGLLVLAGALVDFTI